MLFREHARLLSLGFAILRSNAFAQTPELPQETLPPAVSAQCDKDSSCAGASPANPSIAGFFADIVRDQKWILTSPAHIQRKDLWWLVPLAGGTGFLLASDARNMRERVGTDALAQSRSRFISNAGLGSLAIVPAAVYWWGWRHADDYATDSSLLTARALADSLMLTEGIQLVTRRDRPLDGNGSGKFFDAGVDSSFPSTHAAAAWSIAVRASAAAIPAGCRN